MHGSGVGTIVSQLTRHGAGSAGFLIKLNKYNLMYLKNFNATGKSPLLAALKTGVKIKCLTWQEGGTSLRRQKQDDDLEVFDTMRRGDPPCHLEKH